MRARTRRRARRGALAPTLSGRCGRTLAPSLAWQARSSHGHLARDCVKPALLTPAMEAAFEGREAPAAGSGTAVVPAVAPAVGAAGSSAAAPLAVHLPMELVAPAGPCADGEGGGAVATTTLIVAAAAAPAPAPRAASAPAEMTTDRWWREVWWPRNGGLERMNELVARLDGATHDAVRALAAAGDYLHSYAHLSPRDPERRCAVCARAGRAATTTTESSSAIGQDAASTSTRRAAVVVAAIVAVVLAAADRLKRPTHAPPGVRRATVAAPVHVALRTVRGASARVRSHVRSLRHDRRGHGGQTMADECDGARRCPF